MGWRTCSMSCNVEWWIFIQYPKQVARVVKNYLQRQEEQVLVLCIQYEFDLYAVWFATTRDVNRDTNSWRTKIWPKLFFPQNKGKKEWMAGSWILKDTNIKQSVRWSKLSSRLYADIHFSWCWCLNETVIYQTWVKYYMYLFNLMFTVQLIKGNKIMNKTKKSLGWEESWHMIEHKSSSSHLV